MKKLAIIGASFALTLPATASAVVDCCRDMTCCREGADCCQDMDCCEHGRHAGGAEPATAAS